MTTPGTPAAPAGLRDELGRKLDSLAVASEAARDRLDDDVLAVADELSGRAAERLKLSGEHTIVALAGATGSGKSSLFNALSDMDLAGVGVRRPTTSWALACAWGPDGAGELLTWMGIPPRHQVSRMGMLERSDDTSLEGLILLDLPDHDSTEVAHHVEMDRLVTYSDLLVWVLDPQKYADAAIHERYIRPMADYGAVTLVVLNQIDRIPAEDRAATVADVKRLIEADGLPDVEVLAVSATRGDGMAELRQKLAARIHARNAAKARLAADVGDVAKAVAEAGGTEPVPSISESSAQRLDDSLVGQIGLHHVADSIQTSVRRRVVRRTRWPVLAPFSRSVAGLAPVEIPSLSEGAVDVAVRDFVDEAASGLTTPWKVSLQRAVDSGETAKRISDALSVDPALRADRLPSWSRFVQALQWVLLVALVAGLVGLGALAIERWTDVDLSLPSTPEYLGVTVAGWVAGGAAVAGLLVDVVSRLLARRSAKKAAAAIEQGVRKAIAGVTADAVAQPVMAELSRYSRYRDNLLVALG